MNKRRGKQSAALLFFNELFHNEVCMVKNLWEIAKPVKKAVMIYVGILVIYEALQILESYVISGSIRLYQHNLSQLAWMAFFSGLILYDEIFMRLDNNLDWHIISRIIYPLIRSVKVRSVAKFMQLDMAWHQEHNSGTLIGKVNHGADKIEDIINNFCWDFFPTFVQTLLSVIPLLFFSAMTILIAFPALGLFLWLSYKADKFRHPLREKRHDLYEEDWHMSTESVRSVETAMMFNQRDRLLESYDGIHQNIRETGLMEANRGIFFYNRWRIRVLSWGRRAALGLWIWQLKNGSLDIVGLIYVSVLTEKLFHSFWRFARLIEQATESAEGVNRVHGLFQQEAGVKDNGNCDFTLFPKPNVDIEFENISFGYKEEVPILKNLSLKIPAGQVVALVGPSGAGKTTIRRLAPRLHDVKRGVIRVAGHEVSQWPLEVLRSMFSYVPQGDDVYIYNDTIANNIRFSRPEASLEEVERAAELAGIHKDIVNLTKFPESYESKVGERGIKLSGGQKQRIALARAILSDRPVIILDEATNALDAITEREIQDQLKTIFSQKTVIIIAHRLSTIWDIADKIVVLKEGEKVEEGTHDELLAQGGLYAQMVALQT